MLLYNSTAIRIKSQANVKYSFDLKKSLKRYFSCFFLLFAIGCSDQESAANHSESSKQIKFLKEIPASTSGIKFNNKLVENEQYNFMREQGMLIGAGVGILDVNNDGLQDIFFSANMSGDKLYLILVLQLQMSMRMVMMTSMYVNIWKPHRLKGETFFTSICRMVDSKNQPSSMDLQILVIL